jgi:BirA family biotin operon repressor/biotin-[acetyl-CoA-carboxylase] ligase
VGSEGPARVLVALRSAAAQPRSGEALSNELGVSRAQVWKHVETLRRRGYEIEGERGGGYRLLGTPDRLFPEEIHDGLETKWLGREIHYLDTTDSTNRVAFDLAREGAGHGTAVIAEAQTAGRGRLGRSFHSPAHQNLYTSIVLRPELHTADAPTLIPSAAIAVAEAVAETLPDGKPVEIKWPNDVLLSGLKTAGILMEMTTEATRIDFAVLGIGINLNVDRDTLPEEFRAGATSLKSHADRPVDRIEFVQRLYGILESVLDGHARAGFGSLRSRYEARFRMRGEEVRIVETGGEELRGIAQGIAEDGALLLRQTKSGETVRVIAGDVQRLRPEAAQSVDEPR